MDYGPNQQSAALSFEHGMRNGLVSQKVSEAEQEADTFIAKNEHKAARLEAEWIAEGHTGISLAALSAFGNTLHTITDQTSPAHGGFQPWYGLGLKHWGFARFPLHALEEFYAPPAALNEIAKQVQEAFRQTFGDEFDWMMLGLESREVVTHKIFSVTPGK